MYVYTLYVCMRNRETTITIYVGFFPNHLSLTFCITLNTFILPHDVVCPSGRSPFDVSTASLLK